MKKTPDWLDERIRLGEIPPHLGELADSRSRETDFELSQVELEESDRQILSHLPPDRFAAEVARRRDAQKRIKAAVSASRPAKAVWGTVALACLAGFVFVPRIPIGPDLPPAPTRQDPSSTTPRGTSPVARSTDIPTVPPTRVDPSVAEVSSPGKDWRTKGEVSLFLQREVDGVLVPVTESDVHEPGTRLRLSVSDSLPWAAVFSIDSRGEMAQHWPLAGDSARPVQGMLPRSWELDDAPGRETFVLAWSATPFALDKLRKAIFLDRVHPKVGSKMQVRVVQIARPESPTR